MAEIQKNQINLIAFYLPQFHCIPENDQAYGIGFTEWTNTAKAMPLFTGHYQPKIPMNSNYYSLTDIKVMQCQAQLAKKYGLFGFCYYHYWFKGGKKLLEKPVEMMLHEKSVDMPFCLCWANENWTKRWDGGNNEIIALQNYGGKKDWEKHLAYLVDFFKDERYITIDGKPILIIHRPEQMPHLGRWVRFVRKKIDEYGFPGIVLMVQNPIYYLQGYPKKYFDNFIEFEPNFTREMDSNAKLNKVVSVAKNYINAYFGYKIFNTIRIILSLGRVKPNAVNLLIRDYDMDWKAIIDRNIGENKMIQGAFVDWDNTPRNIKGILYKGASPQKFRIYMSQLIKKTLASGNRHIIFVNAWNEWAEGAYLEPDEKYGYAYLEALKEAIDNTSHEENEGSTE